MAMVRARVIWCVSLLMGVWSAAAHAVEKKPIQVNDRWSVVGVIAGGNAEGKEIAIAVLKNNETRRTYTVSLGETLPSDYQFTLQAVVGKQVSVSDGEKVYVLSYAEADMDERDAASVDNARSSRFLDSYYRSFDGQPIEVQATDTAERPGYDVPLQRFSTLREQSARSRFELFRADRLDAADDQNGDAEAIDGSVVVNYDNFVDEANTDPTLGAWSDQDIGSGFEPADTVDSMITE